ncbi:hypothetical protein J8L88_23380 [Aquimarina sp. MMG015]|uniref:hypothetical protein n=1 Tax=Aquimarina sp. MMG015 TaxID=2822689 RepID=UPI001B39DA25|nr:hypothetical protein [Aquimarina sp. MMG015]MBQ4805819.1 hypothetical protein [Aquimarina sp. MMG015]
MNETLNKIEGIFSIFHDGTITQWESIENGIELIIECEYLAELIDSEFTKFHVELNKILKLELEPWMNPIELPKEIKKSPTEIFKAELEILSAKTENGIVEVSCNQHNLEFNYCGGILKILAEKITVKSENKDELSINELNKMSNSYWNK